MNMVTGTILGQQVKRIEYYPNGQVKRIEYYEPVQAAPYQTTPVKPVWPQPSYPAPWCPPTITWGTGTITATTDKITVS